MWADAIPYGVDYDLPFGTSNKTNQTGVKNSYPAPLETVHSGLGYNPLDAKPSAIPATEYERKKDLKRLRIVVDAKIPRSSREATLKLVYGNGQVKEETLKIDLQFQGGVTPNFGAPNFFKLSENRDKTVAYITLAIENVFSRVGKFDFSGLVKVLLIVGNAEETKSVATEQIVARYQHTEREQRILANRSSEEGEEELPADPRIDPNDPSSLERMSNNY